MPNANGNKDPREDIPPEIAQTIVNDATAMIGKLQAMAGYVMTDSEREMFGAGVGAGMAATIVVLERLGVLKPWSEAPITGVCVDCSRPITWVEAPTGGWWAHDEHPGDGHQAGGPTVKEQMDDDGHYRTIR